MRGVCEHAEAGKVLPRRMGVMRCQQKTNNTMGKDGFYILICAAATVSICLFLLVWFQTPPKMSVEVPANDAACKIVVKGESTK